MKNPVAEMNFRVVAMGADKNAVEELFKRLKLAIEKESVIYELSRPQSRNVILSSNQCLNPKQ